MDPVDNLMNKVMVYVFIKIGQIMRLIFDLIIYLIRLAILNIHNRPKIMDSFPLEPRFEHTHIVGGSGHGKTQLLQRLIAGDILALREGRGSVIVIDSQGDMLGKILHLAQMRELSDRLILIDPSDIKHPPALNLFDFDLDRLNRLKPVDREKLINGAIALYEYLFGALLGAELIQRQGVIFRYLARLMMVVHNAAIHTLMDSMQNPETVKPYMSGLDPISKRFFETQFFHLSLDEIRQQILTRLWGVLSNPILARMFSAERNKVDLFDAMNRGSIILIYTAKSLLKQEGCEILGRFFIALIAQVTQERPVIPEDRMRATFVYIDEAHDYFDESLENLLNQARKYRVGLTLAHQNLDQFEPKLRATVMASTSIKLAGGVSAKDAALLAKEMRCEPEYILSMKKEGSITNFAYYLRNQPTSFLQVKLDDIERMARITQEEYRKIRQINRLKYCRTTQKSLSVIKSMEVEIEGVSKHEMV